MEGTLHLEFPSRFLSYVEWGILANESTFFFRNIRIMGEGVVGVCGQ